MEGRQFAPAVSALAIAAASLFLGGCGDGRGHGFGSAAAMAATALLPFHYFGLGVTADAIETQRRARARRAAAADRARSAADFDVYVGGPNPPELRSAVDPLRPEDAIDWPAVLESLDRHDLHACRLEGTPPGWNHAKVTFKPNGSVSHVTIDWTVWMSRAASSCFRAQLKRLKAPPFQGPPETLGVWFFTF